MGYWWNCLFLLFASLFLWGNATPLRPREHGLKFHPRASITFSNSSIALGTSTGIVIGTRASSSTSWTSSSTSTSPTTLFLSTSFLSTALENATSTSTSNQIGTSNDGSSVVTSQTTRTSSPSSVQTSPSSSIISLTTGSSSFSSTKMTIFSASRASSSSSGQSETSQTGTPSSSTLTLSNSSPSSILSSSSSSSSATRPPGTGILLFTTTSGTRTSGDSASSTLFGLWSALTSGPTTASWPLFLLPTATTAQAEATHEAFLLADMFRALKANRHWIMDPKLKSQFIDSLDKTHNEVFALFNALDVKPPAKSDCSGTKKKRNVISEKKLRAIVAGRSLLSTAIDLAKDVAGLITCATKIVTNLVDNVKLPDSPINVIENLTDVLGTIANELEEDDPEDNKTTTQAKATQSATTSSSCTGQTTFPICTQTVFLSSSEVLGVTSFTVATITSTTCITSTVTGCPTGSPVTITSSTTTSNTTQSSPGCMECSWDGPTQVPVSAGQKRKSERLDGRTMLVPGPDIDVFYAKILRNKTYKSLEVTHRISGTKSSAVFDNFENVPNYMMVAGLFGCTSITVVSEKGAWMSHHWESPGFAPGTTDADFKRNILDPIETQEQFKLFGVRPPQYAPASQMPALFPLLAAGQKLGPETHREVFISTPHATGNPAEYMFKERMELVLDLLTGPGAPLAGVQLTVRKYDKFIGSDPKKDDFDYTARGKVMLQYDNNQVAANSTVKQQAMWRLWMEDQSFLHTWNATDIQKGVCSVKQKRDGSCTGPTSPAFEGGDGPISTGTQFAPSFLRLPLVLPIQDELQRFQTLQQHKRQ